MAQPMARKESPSSRPPRGPRCDSQLSTEVGLAATCSRLVMSLPFKRTPAHRFESELLATPTRKPGHQSQATYAEKLCKKLRKNVHVSNSNCDKRSVQAVSTEQHTRAILFQYTMRPADPHTSLGYEDPKSQIVRPNRMTWEPLCGNNAMYPHEGETLTFSIGTSVA